MGGFARGGDPRPQDPALLDHQLVLRLRAQHQHVRGDGAGLAQKIEPVMTQPLLVADEREHDLA